MFAALVLVGVVAAITAIPFFARVGAGHGFEPGLAIDVLRRLSDDAMGGRATGSEGSLGARDLIRERMADIGLQPFDGDWFQAFRYGRFDDEGGVREGVNVVGWLAGREPATPFIVVSAHYDHLGIRDGAIYNGADDNASGVAAMLALAQAWSAPDDRPVHNVIFVAFDAEEDGFGGSLAFLREPPVPRERVAINLNLDMVSRSDTQEVHVSGTYHHPALRSVVEGVARTSPVTLLIGHDRPEDGSQDWTLLSDHAAFHLSGVPFLYVGVEDHPVYHSPQDDFQTVPIGFFLAAVTTIIKLANAVDQHLAETLTRP
jgi:hypothetical protein